MISRSVASKVVKYVSGVNSYHVLLHSYYICMIDMGGGGGGILLNLRSYFTEKGKRRVNLVKDIVHTARKKRLIGVFPYPL